MNILVLLKMVPDVIEELEVASDGKALDTEFLRLIINERDAHALEEALLLKEKHGGQVTVLALDAPEVDDTLFTALAKGADRAVKITALEPGLTTRATASRLAQVVPTVPNLCPADLILTGCQAIDDLDGMLAPLLACELDRPYLGLVSRVEADPAAQKATVLKEYPGGVHGEFEVPTPAVLGIQAAEKPPRYIPVAKVRAVMKSQTIESVPGPPTADAGPPAVEVLQLAKPEATTHAEMLEGSPEEVAAKLGEILAARGVL